MFENYGQFSTVTVTGTGFSTINGDTVSVIAGAGNNKGGPDMGTQNGTNGITCTGDSVSTTEIACSMYVYAGASAERWHFCCVGPMTPRDCS